MKAPTTEGIYVNRVGVRKYAITGKYYHMREAGKQFESLYKDLLIN